MNILTDYIRNITFYVVFINIIEMIMPSKSEKYSSYIRLFLGLVLMYIIIKHLFLLNINLVNSEVMQNYENYIISNSQNIDIENIEETQKKLVTTSYVNEKQEEIKKLIENETEYEVIYCNIEIDITTENYGDIKDIYIEIREKNESSIEEIKKVEILNEPMSENVENEETLELKKIIKDVYNLSSNNININIVNE